MLVRPSLAVLLVVGCYTPSVPVPPPTPESLAFALASVACEPGPADPECDAGTRTRSVATFSGAPVSGWEDAWVVIRNERTGRGAVGRAEADGAVLGIAFDARDGDRALIDYESVDGQTVGFCLTVHDGASSSAFRCD